MSHQYLGKGLVAGATSIAALTALAPSASAATRDWTCRASAAYIEAEPLLGDQRIEPIRANGNDSVANPDMARCATDESSVDLTLPPPGTPALPVLIGLKGVFAETAITPETGDTRDQTISAKGGVLDEVDVNLGAVRIQAEVLKSSAAARCVNGTPVLTAESKVVNLRINGSPIAVPNDGSSPTVIPGLPLVRVALNEERREATRRAPTSRSPAVRSRCSCSR